MPSSKRATPWFAIVFTGLWLLAGALILFQGGHWQIDTNLSDVTPRTLNAQGTEQATTALRANIESRVLLLLSADDEFALDSAETAMREQLTQLPNIHIQAAPDELFVKLKESLKPYRFNFLTSEQSSQLKQDSAEDIALRAQQSLYSFSAPPRLFAFGDDPLGWHSEALLDLLNRDTVKDTQRLISLNIERGALDMRTQTQLAEEMSSMIERMHRQFDVHIDTSGVFFFAADAATSAKADVTFISTVSTLGVVILLWLAFGSPRALALPVLSVVSGVGFAALITHYLFGALHILTIVFGASLIGIAIDYALHYLVHQSRAGQQHSRKLLRALALSLCTSIVGYSALGFADLPALQKLAVFSCCGLLMAWLTVLVLGPWIGKSTPSESGIFARISRYLVGGIQGISVNGWRLLIAMFAVAALLQVGKGGFFSDDPRVFFNPNTALLASEKRVAQVASDFEPGRYIAIVAKSSDQIYQRVSALLDLIEQQGLYKPSDLSGLPLWLPSAADQAQNYSALATLYEANGAADQLSTTLSADTRSVSDAKHAYRQAQERRLKPEQLQAALGGVFPPAWFTNKQNQVVAFLLIRKGLNSDALGEITHSLEGVEYVNTLQRTSDALNAQRLAAGQYLAFACALIGLILVLRYRSFRGLHLLMIPLGSIAAFLAICPLLGIQVNLFHMMALFLVLGFGMDYAIFSNEMSDRPEIAFEAILLSALTSLLSFGLLAVSEIPVVSSFGWALLIGNSFNLIGAIVLAPASSTTTATTGT